MSKDEVEYGSVDNIFDQQIKGKIDTPWRFQRQLERCNILMAGENQLAFAASVRALLGDLPLYIKNKIVGTDEMEKAKLCPVCKENFVPSDMGRQGEFNSMTDDNYQYQENCGVQIGTPKNPFVIVPGHTEWDFLLDIPKPYRDSHEDEIDIISPVLIEGHLETDYEKLYEIIKEEADVGGLGWRYDKAAKSMGAVEKPIPDGLANEIEKVLVTVMMKHRNEGHPIYSWNELIGSQRHRTPRTPTPPVPQKEEIVQDVEE